MRAHSLGIANRYIHSSPPYYILNKGGLIMFSSFSDGNGSFPHPLCAADEQMYVRLMREGTQEERVEAKRLLTIHNLRLVVHVAKKYTVKDTEDLVSIGSIGLIKGIVSYNPEKGVKLATYASRCIENAMVI